MLLSRLNDDWGWGRSQRSGESGLIPLMIMEDVVSEGGRGGGLWTCDRVRGGMVIAVKQKVFVCQ